MAGACQLVPRDGESSKGRVRISVETSLLLTINFGKDLFIDNRNTIILLLKYSQLFVKMCNRVLNNKPLWYNSVILGMSPFFRIHFRLVK